MPTSPGTPYITNAVHALRLCRHPPLAGADLLVLSRCKQSPARGGCPGPHVTVTDTEIANIRASLTAVGGRIVHARDAFGALDWHRPPPVSPPWSPLNTFDDRVQS